MSLVPTERAQARVLRHSRTRMHARTHTHTTHTQTHTQHTRNHTRTLSLSQDVEAEEKLREQKKLFARLERLLELSGGSLNFYGIDYPPDVKPPKGWEIQMMCGPQIEIVRLTGTAVLLAVSLFSRWVVA